MKLKLDENLPARLATELARLGHDTDTAPQEQLQGQCDERIWEAAQASGRFLITQDLDFSDVRRFKPGTHEGILLVRLKRPTRAGLIQRVSDLFRNEDVETWARCFVVATDIKIRVRKPGNRR